MAYESYPNPLDKVGDTLKKYSEKISVLKCDVNCKCGVFRRGTTVFVGGYKLMKNDGIANIEMWIYDCYERTSLYDCKPYKIEDTYELSVQSTEELLDILEDTFDVSDEKTAIYKKYNKLRKKLSRYESAGDTVAAFANFVCCLSFIGIIAMVMGLLIDREFSGADRYGLPIFTFIEVLSFSVICMKNYVLKYKSEELEAAATSIHVSLLSGNS
ncbi:MAG: hypothetical protein NC120_09865 [Ruminococcus sp.]|nr:hypothetical protein [Ruminococcus sp.]